MRNNKSSLPSLTQLLLQYAQLVPLRRIQGVTQPWALLANAATSALARRVQTR